jgi:GTP pyrophosphokinase
LAALLHDTVEDTHLSVNDIKATFGEEVASLVDGVTKLGKVPLSTKEEEQAENIRKMLMAMSNDIRVIIIKLADRIHNMRNADLYATPKRRISRWRRWKYMPLSRIASVFAQLKKSLKI